MPNQTIQATTAIAKLPHGLDASRPIRTLLAMASNGGKPTAKHVMRWIEEQAGNVYVPSNLSEDAKRVAALTVLTNDALLQYGAVRGYYTAIIMALTFAAALDGDENAVIQALSVDGEELHLNPGIISNVRYAVLTLFPMLIERLRARGDYAVICDHCTTPEDVIVHFIVNATTTVRMAVALGNTVAKYHKDGKINDETRDAILDEIIDNLIAVADGVKTLAEAKARFAELRQRLINGNEQPKGPAAARFVVDDVEIVVLVYPRGQKPHDVVVPQYYYKNEQIRETLHVVRDVIDIDALRQAFTVEGSAR